MDIISRCGPPEVGFSRAANVTYGILCNRWGTDIVLFVPQDNTNPTENGKYLELAIYESYDL
jgi:hypothetical protein